MGPIVTLGASEKRKIPHTCRKSNSDFSVVQPRHWTGYALRFPGAPSRKQRTHSSRKGGTTQKRFFSPWQLDQLCGPKNISNRVRANPGRRAAMTTVLCAAAPNICGSSGRNLLHVTLLAPRNLRRILDFWTNLYKPVLIYGVPEVVSRQRYESDHSRPPGTKKKNTWIYKLHSPMLPHVMVIKHSLGQMSSTFTVHGV